MPHCCCCWCRLFPISAGRAQVPLTEMSNFYVANGCEIEASGLSDQSSSVFVLPTTSCCGPPLLLLFPVCSPRRCSARGRLFRANIRRGTVRFGDRCCIRRSWLDRGGGPKERAATRRPRLVDRRLLSYIETLPTGQLTFVAALCATRSHPHDIF